MNIYRLCILLLLFSIQGYAQDQDSIAEVQGSTAEESRSEVAPKNKDSILLDWFLNADRIDSSLFEAMKADSDFRLQFVSFTNKYDSSFLFDSYNFQLKQIPEREYADTLEIDFIPSHVEEHKFRIPVFKFIFSPEKAKYARQKFNDLDKKITKIAIKRYYDHNTQLIDDKNKIHYLLPVTTFFKNNAVILTIVPDNDKNKTIPFIVTVQFFD